MARIVAAVVISLGAASLGGCFEAHGRTPDGEVGVPDGGVRDARADHDTGSGNSDGGLRIVECDFRDESPAGDWCYCWELDVDRGGAGICLTPRSGAVLCDIGVGCPNSGQRCNDLGWTARENRARTGVCVLREMCRYLSERDEYRPRCYYEDGTPFQTGELASTSCAAGDRGRLCGPGCGSCDEGEQCVGVSERSGLGLCVRGTASDSPDHCTWPDIENGVECGGSNACLGFVLPPDVTAVQDHQPWHACVPRERCHDVASRYPERFRCVE